MHKVGAATVLDEAAAQAAADSWGRRPDSAWGG